MEAKESGVLLIVMYVLVVLFVGCIYIQGDLLSDPAAATTLKNLEVHPVGSQLSGLTISANSALMILGLITGFFAIAWRIQRLRSF